MTALPPRAWRALLLAFIVWAAHFMACWAAAEMIWPGQWQAHVAAGGLTALALPLLGWHGVRLRASRPHGDVDAWARRIGLAATVLAAVAVVFTAMPPLILRS